MKAVLLEEQQAGQLEVQKEGGHHSGSFNIVAPSDGAYQSKEYSRDGSALDKPKQ